jgi:hypothetical protein
MHIDTSFLVVVFLFNLKLKLMSARKTKLIIQKAMRNYV